MRVVFVSSYMDNTDFKIVGVPLKSEVRVRLNNTTGQVAVFDYTNELKPEQRNQAYHCVLQHHRENRRKLLHMLKNHPELVDREIATPIFMDSIALSKKVRRNCLARQISI